MYRSAWLERHSFWSLHHSVDETNNPKSFSYWLFLFSEMIRLCNFRIDCFHGGRSQRPKTSERESDWKIKHFVLWIQIFIVRRVWKLLSTLLIVPTLFKKWFCSQLKIWCFPWGNQSNFNFYRQHFDQPWTFYDQGMKVLMDRKVQNLPYYCLFCDS